MKTKPADGLDEGRGLLPAIPEIMGILTHFRDEGRAPRANVL